MNPIIRFFYINLVLSLFNVGYLIVEHYNRRAEFLMLGIHILGMFPEGTRTYSNGMVSAKSGTAYLAIQEKCPVILVAIDGAQNILENIFKKTQVKIKIYTQIFPIEETNPQSLTKQIMHTLAENLPYELRGIYA